MVVRICKNNSIFLRHIVGLLMGMGLLRMCFINV